MTDTSTIVVEVAVGDPIEVIEVGNVGGPTGPAGPPGPASTVPGPQGPPGVWVQMTQAAYDALPVKDPGTLYVIVG